MVNQRIQIKTGRRGRSQGSIFALFLVGAGLVILGLTALLLLPKPGEFLPGAEEFSAIPIEVNFAAPQLTLTDLQGRQVSLADYNGQVVLVNNWATWCPPCKAEMPALQAFYEKHQDQGFVLIGIDAGDPPDDVARFAQDNALTFPIWLDPENQALAALRNQNLPNSIVIGRDGTVRLAWTGAITLATLEKYITPMLED